MADCIHDLSGSLDGEFHFGIQGPPGPKGDPFTYEDFTEEQLAALTGPVGPAGPVGPVGPEGYTPRKGIDYFTQEDQTEFLKPVNDKIKTMEDQIADLMYEPISVVSFDHNLGTREKGEYVNGYRLDWMLSKKPATLTVDGKERTPVKGGSANVSNVVLAYDHTFELVATDERGEEAKATTKVSFLNGVYYGALADGATIDSAAILSLNKKIQSGRGVTFTAELGDGARIAYAIPASGYGTPTFVDAVEKYSIDMTKLDDPVSFTNVHGYTTDYNVWLSTNVLKGSIKVVVS